jgi:hypothetical protein
MTIHDLSVEIDELKESRVSLLKSFEYGVRRLTNGCLCLLNLYLLSFRNQISRA